MLELLKDNNIYSAIAFTRTKARANRLALALAKHNISSERIHGDRSQAQRTRALADFKRGKLRVLVATDVAARGIDVVDLGHVVNFDVPMVAEDYVHRVGRTARAEQTGDAITFVSREEEPLFRDIEKAVGRRIDRSKTPELPGRAGDRRHAARAPGTAPDAAERRPPLHPGARAAERPAQLPRPRRRQAQRQQPRQRGRQAPRPLGPTRNGRDAIASRHGRRSAGRPGRPRAYDDSPNSQVRSVPVVCNAVPVPAKREPKFVPSSTNTSVVFDPVADFLMP